jgi:2-polyprenyl-6-methoxyphenol hydroxylase-like FAD-dependent oxidoreductase
LNERTPVLVVGGGPVGLALAGDLGWRGHACVLVDNSDGMVVQPKMVLVGVRTLEFCRRWGIAHQVEQSGYPADYSQDYVYVTSLDGYELARERFPARASEPCPPQSPQKRERCPQHIFEPLLARWASSFPSVSIRRQVELIDLEEREHDVLAQLRDLRTNQTQEISAGYVVGADGAASTVRRLLNISMSGKPLLNYTTHVLFRSEELPKLHDKGQAYRFIFIGPEGTWLTITSVNGDDVWRMQLIGTKDKRAADTGEIRAALLRAAGRDFDYSIIDVMPWARRELVADSYGTRRVFIAGDAAHLTSPTGAFGMNTGVQDSIDLGWKLDAVLRGWAGENLLASYEQERRPVAVRNVTEATVNLERMLSTRDRRPPPNLQEPGEEAERARRAYGEWYAETMRPEWHTIGINLGYRYDDSPIIWRDGTDTPPNEVSTYRQTARPGARAPHVWLPDGCSTLDLFGRGFVLLHLGIDPPVPDGFVVAAAQRNLPLQVEMIAAAAVHAAYQARLVLVRPDGHVAWRNDELPKDAGAVLDVVRGALARQKVTEVVKGGGVSRAAS